MDLETCCPYPLHRLKCYLNLSFEQQKVSLDFLEKIKYKSFLVQKFWSASYKICSCTTLNKTFACTCQLIVTTLIQVVKVPSVAVTSLPL